MKSTCAGGLFLRIEAGVLERLEGDLYQQALLRIHELGLAGRNAERIRVELVDGGEKAALLGNSCVGYPTLMQYIVVNAELHYTAPPAAAHLSAVVFLPPSLAAARLSLSSPLSSQAVHVQ